jgi:hypothetical protein
MRFSKFQAFYERGRQAAEECLPDIHRLIDKCHE